MDRARRIMRAEHGVIRSGMILIDRAEWQAGKGADGYAWDAQGWYGGDINRLVVRSEGEGSFGGKLDHAEVQALWNRAIDPWWNLRAGVRQDLGEGPDHTHAVLGVQGLAPYRFDLDGALFLSDAGDLTARLAVEYDQRLTRKLVLQPSVELDFAAQDVPELGIGTGLSTAEAGLRVRYEFVPEFAPYIGVRYERAFGDTARFRRLDGKRRGDWRMVLGLRTWF